jgi:V8-like Glu-specific endopeptidase
MGQGAMPPRRTTRWTVRLAGRERERAACRVAFRRAFSLMAAALAAYAVTPTALAAGDSPATRVAQRDPGAAAAGIPFGGAAAVGALFTSSGGTLGAHFCTASVIASPAGNLLITAAHCMQGKPLSPAGSVVFAPDYHNGIFPYGTWPVTAVYVDSRWQQSQDPNDDIAFLTAGGPHADIQRVTGAETLMLDQPPQQVQVVGYPDQTNAPISCTAPARRFGTRQMVFDCDNYTNGTSGGPFLADIGPATGDGWVIGVIGGYQQGGDTPDVSYSPTFASSLLGLYETAVSGGQQPGSG